VVERVVQRTNFEQHSEYIYCGDLEPGTLEIRVYKTVLGMASHFEEIGDVAYRAIPTHFSILQRLRTGRREMWLGHRRRYAIALTWPCRVVVLTDVWGRRSAGMRRG
jgi:hypothetical protein